MFARAESAAPANELTKEGIGMATVVVVVVEAVAGAFVFELTGWERNE